MLDHVAMGGLDIPPSSPRGTEMTLEQALIELRAGRKIKLSNWRMYLVVRDGELYLGNIDGRPETAPVRVVEARGFIANDWEVLQ
jgi:hypothetical protein